MLYCSIDEAWNTYDTPQASPINKKKYIKKNIFKKNIIETFTETIKEKKDLSSCECNKIMKHILKCPKCYKKLSNKFRPKLLFLLHNILDEYREMIILILMGIFLMIFFNLINNLTNNK